MQEWSRIFASDQFSVASAQRAVELGNLLPPADSNACELFRQVLELDLGNKSADSGLREIQFLIAEQTRNARGREGLHSARRLADLGLESFPESPLPNDLLSDIERSERQLIWFPAGQINPARRRTVRPGRRFGRFGPEWGSVPIRSYPTSRAAWLPHDTVR